GRRERRRKICPPGGRQGRALLRHSADVDLGARIVLSPNAGAWSAAEILNNEMGAIAVGEHAMAAGEVLGLKENIVGNATDVGASQVDVKRVRNIGVRLSVVDWAKDGLRRWCWRGYPQRLRADGIEYGTVEQRYHRLSGGEVAGA